MARQRISEYEEGQKFSSEGGQEGPIHSPLGYDHNEQAWQSQRQPVHGPKELVAGCYGCITKETLAQ